MARETLAELHERITQLEERNALLAEERAALAESLVTERSARLAATASPPPAGRTTTASRGSVGRSIIAGVLVVLGLIVAPLALVVDFAQAQVTDTDTFVAAYAPLAESPAVQEAITEAVVAAVNANVDLELLTGGIVDGLQQLELPNFVSNSLDLLRAPMVEGVNALIRWGVTSIVTSDWFPVVWEQTLRLTHSQLMAVLRGDPNAIAQISGDTVSLQLGPIVSVLRDQLISGGVTIAQLIPADLDVSIPLADVQGIGNAKTAYALAVASGVWLPIIAAALLIGGIAVAPRRRGWVMGSSIALGAIAILFAIGLNVGRGVVVSSTNLISSAAAGRVYDAATGALMVTIVALIAVAIIGIISAWLAGPSKLAVRSRLAIDRFPALARRRLALTNPFSRYLQRHRSLVFWLIAAAVIITIVFFRPLTILVVLVAVLAGIVLILVVDTFRAQEPSAEQLLPDPATQDLAEDVAR